MEKKDYITASQIGDFVYCKRGWLLRIQGLLPTTFIMEQGSIAHENLFQQLFRIKLVQKILLVIGIILLILLLVLLVIM